MTEPLPYYDAHGATLHAGDCLDVLRTLPDCSVDAVVTDPPYGLEFMGKEWDKFDRTGPASFENLGGPAAESRPDRGDKGSTSSTRYADKPRWSTMGPSATLSFQSWCTRWAAECLRVLKPGGHLLAFGGTRTWHRLACAIEDAGFEVRDSIAWMYGSGFPKSLDVSKAIDKAAGATREIVGVDARYVGMSDRAKRALGAVVHEGTGATGFSGDPSLITAPATAEAARWAGWGTALKPAFEPIVVARKPLAGTVAANVLAHGTGALNIDGCRIGDEAVQVNTYAARGPFGDSQVGNDYASKQTAGRWPANVVLDEHAAAALDAQSGESASRAATTAKPMQRQDNEVYGKGLGSIDPGNTHTDTGGASRFFKVIPTTQEDDPCSLASGHGSAGTPTTGTTSPERSAAGASSPVEVAGLPTSTDGARFIYTAKADATERPNVAGVRHPTVKPLDLMRWLVRLVTPPGGTVLEPFAGSGTTVEACLLEGFQCIAIEREADYLPLIVARITRQRDPVAHVRLVGDEHLTLFDDATEAAQ